jgi:hypothetical protein
MLNIGGMVRAAAVPALLFGAGATIASAAVGGLVLADPDRPRAAKVGALYQQGILLVALAGFVPPALELVSAGWALLRGRPIPAFHTGVMSTAGGAIGALAGAFAGNALIRRADEALRPAYYDDRREAVDRALDDARAVLRAHGIDDAHGLDPITPSIDETSVDAAFSPPLFGDQDHIRIGISHLTGTSLAFAPDLIYHEFGHRVIDRYRPTMRVAQGEVGTVHESVADTIAAGIDVDDWTFGEDAVPYGTRSMEHPDDPVYVDAAHGNAHGGVPYPAHRSQLYTGSADRGGAHINVGIPDRAAFLIGSQLGRDTMLTLYLHAIEHTLPDTPGIADLAAAVRSSARQLYGDRSREFDTVDAAWNSVGYTDAT